MRGILIGGLVGLLVGVIFILFSAMYSNYASENQVAAALTAIFLWIIFGGIVAGIIELSFPRNPNKNE